MTKSGKHCGKRRNCTFSAISSFVTMFSKSRLLQRRQKASIWGKGLIKFLVVFIKYWYYFRMFACMRKFGHFGKVSVCLDKWTSESEKVDVTIKQSRKKKDDRQSKGNNSRSILSLIIRVVCLDSLKPLISMNDLILSHLQTHLDESAEDDFWKQCGKWRKLLIMSNFSFCHNIVNSIQ